MNPNFLTEHAQKPCVKRNNAYKEKYIFNFKERLERGQGIRSDLQKFREQFQQLESMGD